MFFIEVSANVLFASPPTKKLKTVVPSSSKQSDYDLAHHFLSESNFDEALKTFQQALRSDFDNKKLAQEFEMLRRMIILRAELDNETNALRWKLISERLQKYYMENSIHDENIKLSIQMFKRSQSTEHAGYVIKAYTQAGRFREAFFFIDTLDESNPIVHIEKATVYLAADETAKARHIARSLSADQFCSPEELLRLARIQAATGLHATAVKTLANCFKQTPKHLLAKIKREAANSPEFEHLLSSSEFIEAMTVQSDILSNDPPCARKWIGVRIDESPKYLRGFTTKEINYDEWRITP